jgi:hypothetical protein
MAQDRSLPSWGARARHSEPQRYPSHLHGQSYGHRRLPRLSAPHLVSYTDDHTYYRRRRYLIWLLCTVELSIFHRPS